MKEFSLSVSTDNSSLTAWEQFNVLVWQF